MKFEQLRDLMVNRVVGYRIRFHHANGLPDITPEPDEDIFIRSEEAAHRFARGMSRMADGNNVNLFNNIRVVRMNVLEDEMVCGNAYNVERPVPTAQETIPEPIPEAPVRLTFDSLTPEQEKAEEPMELNNPVEETEENSEIPSVERPLVAPSRDEPPPRRRNFFNRRD